MMKVLNLQQGSQEWHAIRAKHFTASEAPAMLGLSKYTSRNELLRQKAFGIAKDIDANTQRLFDAGHAAEESARPIAEQMIGETLYPVTGAEEIDGLPLLASFDGLTLTEETVWENKLYNEDFSAYIATTGDAPDTHWPQIEQQLLVSGASRALFTVSDGTEANTTTLWYESKPERRAALISGWKQFAEDLKNYQHIEVIPAAVAAPQAQLPAVSVHVMGSIEIRDNLAVFGNALIAYVERINKKPETDQDFADLEASCKTLKDAETALDAAENNALGQASSIDQMRRIVAEYRDLARSTRLTIEKLVKAEKDNRRNKIVAEAQEKLRAFISGLNSFMPPVVADFAAAAKGKKSMTSIQDAVDTELARAKINAIEINAMIDANLKIYGELASGYEASFADLGRIVNQQPDACRALIEQRIAQRKADDEKRLEAEREKIRAEERAAIERQANETKQREADEYQKKFEAHRIAGLWIEAMQSAVAEASKIKDYAEEIRSPEPNVWKESRDHVAAMLEDMTMAELNLARIALAKIKQQRQQHREAA